MKKIDLGYLKFSLDEILLIGNKRNETKLGFAVLYKYFQLNHRFPQNRSDIPDEFINYIGKQVGVKDSLFEDYDWNSRSTTYHRKQIRNLFGFREYAVADSEIMKLWLLDRVLRFNDDIDYLKDEFYKRLIHLKIEPTSNENIERIINSAINTYESNIYENIFKKLPSETIEKIESFLVKETDNSRSEQTIWFQDFNDDPDGANISSVFNESSKLRVIEEMNIPEGICDEIPPRYLKKYYKRSKSENISELRRHPECIKYVSLTIFFHFKTMEIKDNLVDLLIKIIHNLDTNASKKVKKELAEPTNYTRNKNKLLLKIAKAVVKNPEAKTCDVIYPIADEKKLKNLIHELESKSDDVLNKNSYIKMRSSYYRIYGTY